MRRGLTIVLALCLLARGICFPHRHLRKRATESEEQNGTSVVSINTTEQKPPSDEISITTNEIVSQVPYDDDDDDDDDDDFEPMHTSSSGDGSNIFTLLRIAGAILPSSSNANILIRNMIHQLLKVQPLIIRRQSINDNEILIDYTSQLKTPKYQSTDKNSDDNNSGSKSETIESNDNSEEESIESLDEDSAKEDSDANDASADNNDSDYDSDEPPGGGDGQGGGILGLLAGLSGGEDGQSDLGSLLATIGGIVANLSGDGVDLNALIASGIGLFVGLLSEGEENPGAILASYLLTSLDTISGGGSKNNGAFFGTFLSKLVKGTSAVGDSEESSEDNGTKMKMSDSAGFFASFLMALLGDMSKGSSGGSHR